MWQRIGVSVAVVLTLTSAAMAQRKQPPEKFSPRPVQTAPQPSARAPGQPPIVYSPWVKFCSRDRNDAQAKDICLTVKEARLETHGWEVRLTGIFGGFCIDAVAVIP